SKVGTAFEFGWCFPLAVSGIHCEIGRAYLSRRANCVASRSLQFKSQRLALHADFTLRETKRQRNQPASWAEKIFSGRTGEVGLAPAWLILLRRSVAHGLFDPE